MTTERGDSNQLY